MNVKHVFGYILIWRNVVHIVSPCFLKINVILFSPIRLLHPCGSLPTGFFLKTCMNLPSLPCSPHARSYRSSCLDLHHTWRGAKTLKPVHCGMTFILILFLPTSPRMIFSALRTYTAVFCVVCLTQETEFYTEIMKKVKYRALYILISVFLFSLLFSSFSCVLFSSLHVSREQS